MREIHRLRKTIALWRSLEARCRDLLELAEDPALHHEIESEAVALTLELSTAEARLTLTGPHDEHPAIVTIQSGAGGTDSHDWVQLLLGMYSGWAQAGNRPLEIMNLTYGDEAGLRGATLEIGGLHAYGRLKAEQGVHRLVRRSPYDPAGLRHTSFAGIEILPALEPETAPVIRPEDLKTDTFGASGPGGQNVQKTATAVRITHRPTGIAVSCQTERSQHQNRQYAMRILAAKLRQRQEQQKAGQLAQLRGPRSNPEWGNKIRSYILHPQQSVKDHRTGLKTANADSVLAGNIGPFIDAWLLQQTPA